MDLKSFRAGIKQNKELTLVGPMAIAVPKELAHLPQILVDGGSRIKKKHLISISVGDGDSWGKKLDIRVPSKKDYSDLSLALSLIPKQIKIIHLVGFWGGREDHQFINLGEIHHFLSRKKQVEVKVWAKQKLMIWGLSKGQFNFSHTGTFSLFNFKNCKVNIKGKCEYSMKGSTLRAYSSHGLSNVGFGAMEIKSSAPLLVIFPSHIRNGF